MVSYKANALFHLYTWLWVISLFITLSIIAAGPIFFRYLRAYSHTFRNSSIKFKLQFLTALMFMIGGMYVSTGTLSPYANTLKYPGYIHVDECGYIYNGDYPHFAALYYLFDGKSKESWEFSVVQRRFLYNFLSYPVMKLVGHNTGGVLMNFLLMIGAFVIFVLFLIRYLGERGAIAGMWLIASYPGISYYAGQPFLYGIIAPATLLIFMALCKLENTRGSFKVLLLSLVMGILCTGYDLLVYIFPATLFLLIIQRRFRDLPLAALGIVAPLSLWAFILHALGGTFEGSNADVYSEIIHSYFSSVSWPEWFHKLSLLPLIGLKVYLYSSFFFLPSLTIMAVLLWHSFKHKIVLSEILFPAAVVLVFLFVNAAPPYNAYWQLCGDWIARLYGPVFVVLVIICARTFGALAKAPIKNLLFTCALLLTIIGNVLVITGPITNDLLGLSSKVYWAFYKHESPDNMKKNLHTFGRRPIGFCRDCSPEQ